MSCINLRERFGHRYRIEFDPAHKGRADDPWLQQISCQRAHIYPHGGNWLGVATNGRGPTAKAIAGIAGVCVLQDGDDGINAVFPVELFSKVAALCKPRRKRQVSDAERQRLAGLSAKHGFRPVSQTRKNEPETTLAG